MLDSALMHKAGINENDIVPDLRMLYVNNKLAQMYRLLDGLNDPWYHKTTTLSAGADTIFIKDAGGTTTLSAVDATLHILTRTAGTWKLGEVFSAAFYNSASGARICDFVARISSGAGTAAGTYTVIAGTDVGMTLTSARYTVAIFAGTAATTLDLSALYVKSILKIYDNAYTGGKIRLYKEIIDPAIFALVHRDPFYVSEVLYFQRGDTLDLFVGTSATALGTIQFEYRGKPAPCVSLTTDVVIDIPPEENQVLMNEVLAEYLTHVNKPIPQDVADSQKNFQARYSAVVADSQKQLNEVKGKRSV